jgi:hypothetical protein
VGLQEVALLPDHFPEVVREVVLGQRLGCLVPVMPSSSLRECQQELQPQPGQLLELACLEPRPLARV